MVDDLEFGQWLRVFFCFSPQSSISCIEICYCHTGCPYRHFLSVVYKGWTSVRKFSSVDTGQSFEKFFSNKNLSYYPQRTNITIVRKKTWFTTLKNHPHDRKAALLWTWQWNGTKSLSLDLFYFQPVLWPLIAKSTFSI